MERKSFSLRVRFHTFTRELHDSAKMAKMHDVEFENQIIADLL